ncbi:hypothetical protein T492DRAFT_839690 [Pavlovales sp. CCMP2436]|nr:hypothetical protein T492DRAFT_839690 [Pavlovales sp. CCMP2436]
MEQLRNAGMRSIGGEEFDMTKFGQAEGVTAAKEEERTRAAAAVAKPSALSQLVETAGGWVSGSGVGLAAETGETTDKSISVMALSHNAEFESLQPGATSPHRSRRESLHLQTTSKLLDAADRGGFGGDAQGGFRGDAQGGFGGDVPAEDGNVPSRPDTPELRVDMASLVRPASANRATIASLYGEPLGLTDSRPLLVFGSRFDPFGMGAERRKRSSKRSTAAQIWETAAAGSVHTKPDNELFARFANFATLSHAAPSMSAQPPLTTPLHTYTHTHTHTHTQTPVPPPNQQQRGRWRAAIRACC